ncbi:CotH kinase family protein [Wenyingzhuangia sp. IMCC45467]
MNIKIKNIQPALLVLIIALLAVSCREVEVVPNKDIQEWTLATHTDVEGINYNIVFPQNKVNRVDIVFSPEEYKSMRSNLASLITEAAGPNVFSDDKPVYAPCDLYFNEQQWFHVGIRYKGNSSLFGAYNNGNGKLPLRLKFDVFEDEYPEIKNQRFYGFQDLSLGSNYNDASYIREKVATELFRDFGVPAVKTAFYEVYVDEGSGVPVYYGLYTLDEVVFDTMLFSVFGSNTGNCYKPEGRGSMFSANEFNLEDFEKKTNEELADWSDIQELYAILHSPLRTTDVETWKTNLESVFDVQGFLKYLAVNNTIQNWDTYGNMRHNYFLYHDPADGLIKWIVWDNNEAFLSGSAQLQALSLGMTEVSDDWTLITFLMGVASYEQDYKTYLKDFVDNYYNPSIMETKFDNYYNLILSSVTSESPEYTSLFDGSEDFETAIETMKAFCVSRNEAVTSYLAN